MWVITEKQRDEILHLAQISKDVSNDYESMLSINEQMMWLSPEVRSESDFMNVDKQQEIVEEKINDLYHYISDLIN